MLTWILTLVSCVASQKQSLVEGCFANDDRRVSRSLALRSSSGRVSYVTSPLPVLLSGRERAQAQRSGSNPREDCERRPQLDWGDAQTLLRGLTETPFFIQSHTRVRTRTHNFLALVIA